MKQMHWWTIDVPTSLLFDRNLPLTARYLYMVLLDQYDVQTQACSLSQHALLGLSGLGSRDTLRKHLRHLQQAGWLFVTESQGHRPARYELQTPHGTVVAGVAAAATVATGANATGANVAGATVTVPGGLIQLPSLSPMSKWLYVFLLAHCPPQTNSCRIRQDGILGQAGIGSDHAVRAAVAQLCETGWLTVLRSRSGSIYRLHDPHLSLRISELRRVKYRLRHGEFRGEGLLKELLNQVITDMKRRDNARLDILINPLTSERMEFDCWYREAKVAIEFHGSQHYTPSERFSEKVVNEQRSRDLMKEALARRNGITLVIFQSHELTFETVIAKLKGLLPMRELREEDPVVRHLNMKVRSYFLNTPEGWFAQ